jgi:Protein of unknown function (DUF3301)
MSEMLLIAVLVLGFWFLFDTLRAREGATRIAKDACKTQGLQFLDDTAQGFRIRLVRDAEGIMQLRRTFLFEFSDDGVTRRNGSVVMFGNRVEAIELEPYRVAPTAP